MLKDRPEFNKSEMRPEKRPDIEMLTCIIDELDVTLKVLKSGKGRLDSYQCQRIIASNEWDHIVMLCDELPSFEDWRETHWDKLNYETGFVPHTQKIKFNHNNIIKYLSQSLKDLKTHLSDLDKFDELKFDKIQDIYNSQAFCQLTSPMLKNPKLANEYSKEIKTMRKRTKTQRSRLR